MSSEITTIEWSSAQIALLGKTLAPELNQSELALFVQVCRSMRLDPFSKEIYASKIRGRVTFMTSINGYRTLAERTGKYAGQTDPQWCGEDAVWKDVWLPKYGLPSAARVGVLRHDFKAPAVAVALYNEYLQLDGNGRPNQMWSKMPANQLAKCAESLALRKAFPRELAGIYTADEMAQASNDTQQRSLTTGQRAELGAIAEMAGTTTAGLFPEEETLAPKLEDSLAYAFEARIKMASTRAELSGIARELKAANLPKAHLDVLREKWGAKLKSLPAHDPGTGFIGPHDPQTGEVA